MEYAQVIMCIISAVLSALIAKRFLNNKSAFLAVMYGLLAFGLLFISLEEISWGQRLFNINNPEYFDHHNLQNEISLHNLDSVHPQLNKLYWFVGAFGGFGWLILLMFTSKTKAEHQHILNYIIPDWFISPYFFFLFFFYFFYPLLDYFSAYFISIGLEKLCIGNFLLWRDQEVGELLLYMGFLIFTAYNFLRLGYSSPTTLNTTDKTISFKEW